MRLKRRLHRAQAVVRKRQRVHHGLRRYARRPWNSERRHPTARLHQQCIRVPVVAPLKLNDERPPRKPARQPYRRHARLRPGRHKAQLLNRRKALNHQLREVRLRSRARPKRSTPPSRLANRLDCRRKRMPQQHRPPAPKQVHIAVAVGVRQPRSFSTHHKRRAAAHRTKRPHRRIHPAGQVLFRAPPATPPTSHGKTP
jgi:hypothetical protein